VSAAEISPDLVERMVDHIRKAAERYRDVRTSEPLHRELLELAAELPVPVDPDLVEAREMVARSHDVWPDSAWHVGQAENARAGILDGCFRVSDTLAGIKRGRELAESGK
jgi:hypothetical protein